jgi:hypothetical protein
MPPTLPPTRCALTAPFHPCRPWTGVRTGGLLSVALSLGSPPAGVTRRHVVVEPGLSSSAEAPATARPSGPRGKWRAPGPRSTPRRKLVLQTVTGVQSGGASAPRRTVRVASPARRWTGPEARRPGRSTVRRRPPGASASPAPVPAGTECRWHGRAPRLCRRAAPGLAVPAAFRMRRQPQRGDHRRRVMRAAGHDQAPSRRSAISRARVSPSATPSTRSGRQCRWNARTTVAVRGSNSPEGAQS